MAGKPRSHLGLGQSLVQKQTQRLIITQDLRQSIELLPMSTLELSDRIQKELMENPLLEDAGEGESGALAELVPVDKSRSVNEQRDENAERDDGSYSAGPNNLDTWREERSLRSLESGSGGAERTERKHQFLQNAVVSTETLADHLLWQLRLSKVTPAELRAGEIIVSAIDGRGYLTQSLEDLFRDSGVPLKDAQRTLRLIYALDPVGCGAHNVQSTLIIQAKLIYPHDEVLHDVLTNHFSDLEKLDYRKIERNTGYTERQIQSAVQLTRHLEPFPGTLFSSKAPEYVVPDVIVAEIDGNIEIIINDDWLPHLQLNEEYREMLKKQGAQEKQYLQEKTNAALWLMKSLKQRRATLFRVMTTITEFQDEFFRKGPGHLKPLTLKQVADKVEFHESTVSRVTTNKYAQTKWGIFELKYFFSSSLSGTVEGSERHSARSIQDRIRQVVAGEDSENPLSDQQIVDIFKKEGVQIARRTVAKYRKVLKILPGDRRKKLKRLHPGKSPDS